MVNPYRLYILHEGLNWDLIRSMNVSDSCYEILTSYLPSFTNTYYGWFSLPKAVYLNECDNVSVDRVASATCNEFKSRYV